MPIMLGNDRCALFECYNVTSGPEPWGARCLGSSRVGGPGVPPRSRRSRQQGERGALPILPPHLEQPGSGWGRALPASGQRLPATA
jgi:hypothetical protein